MSTWKATKLRLQDEDDRATVPPATGDDSGLKTAEIRSLKIDADAYDAGDPYNRTGQFLVEQLRKLEKQR